MGAGNHVLVIDLMIENHAKKACHVDIENGHAKRTRWFWRVEVEGARIVHL
jgi:hypothetical protein